MRTIPLPVLAILSVASPAFAHAFLERASPPVGSEVAAAPHEIALTFTEGVEPLFSSIELRDAHGVVVATGTPRTEQGNNRRLVVELPALRSGSYSVIWHATSVDTHRTEGSYQFTVR
jgi:methionine-rich copper-binding protein CopC